MTTQKFRLWPRSLFGRNVLLIVGLIMLAELGIAVAFGYWVQKPRLERMVEFTEAYMTTVEQAASRMDEATRQDYARQLSAQGPVWLVQAHPPVQAETKERYVLREFLNRLQRELGNQHPIHWEDGPPPRLWIGLQLQGTPWWLSIDAQGFVGNARPIWLGVMLAAGLLAAMGAALIQHHINRPLDTLADAADQLANGHYPAIDLSHAPTEIARLTERFQHMATTLAATEREREIMLAGISHDLRTPLAKLRLAAAMISGADNTDLVQSMVRNIAAADAVIDQFIDFARFGQGEAEVACEVGELIHSVAQQSDIPRLHLQTLPALPIYHCRPVALRRAITNLVENALRYSEGNVTLTARQEDGSLLIEIADQGPGIAETELQRIRQPFARLEQARNGPPGAGLGLAIVERVAQLHGGRLSLSNRPEGGLLASLLLPLREEDAAA